jgi:catechol 2,3-dioxygenase-like lactoylglutathione lyase family enzyme
MTKGAIHHIELWVPDLSRSVASWGWLLGELGYQPHGHWATGRSWALGTTYIAVEHSAAIAGGIHDRHRPGLNHVAFHAGHPSEVDRLVKASEEHGWTALFAERYPHAGAPDVYAGYLADLDGFEVELVASSPGALIVTG